jgi:Fe-S-cluster-containing dehydrogenase component
MTGKRLVVDTSKCIGCKACQVACQQWHSLEAEDTTFTGSYQNPPDMSGTNLTVAKFTEIEASGKVKWLMFKDMCRHCLRPSCKGSCPLGAIKKQPNGIVRIDETICDPDACSASSKKPCQWGCPFYVPKNIYVKNTVEVATKMRKCDLCYNRMNASPEATEMKNPPFKSTDGKTKSALPACLVTCPPGAITWGNADPMLTKAKNRVKYLKANGHPNARIYPPQTSWPSHVIWILLEPKETYGLPT